MKKLFTLSAVILITFSVFAQSPQKMNYQAVIRNSSNALVTSSPVGIRISILQGSPTGTEVYKEIYNPNPQTNTNGLVTLEIGGGIPLIGTFTGIDWSTGPYFLKTETDPTGGTSYTISGTSQLLSVPYALYAKTSGISSDVVTITGDQTITGIKAFNNDLLINELTIGRGKGAITTNSVIGYQAFSLNTTGYANSANGYQALSSNTTGYGNTANGYQALKSNTTANGNTANGYQALYLNTTGGGNTAFGFGSLNSNTTGQYCTSVGEQAIYSNTTGNNLTAIGAGALIANTTGNNNTAIGKNTLSANTTGYWNTATGMNSLLWNSIGYANTANGNDALTSNTTGSGNTAVGYQALKANSINNLNTAVGQFALTNNTGFENTAFGSDALLANTSGTTNTAIGVDAGNANTTGTSNTFIGYLATSFTGNLTNASAIGAGALVTSSNTMVFGQTTTVGWGFGISPGSAAIKVGSSTLNGNGATLTLSGVWTNASDISKKYDIENINYGLNEVMKLHPVTYKLKGSNNQDIGFIAQEVKKIVPEIIYGEDGHMTMSYGQLTSVLVKAIQQQQKQIEELKKEITLLKSK